MGEIADSISLLTLITTLATDYNVKGLLRGVGAEDYATDTYPSNNSKYKHIFVYSLYV